MYKWPKCDTTKPNFININSQKYYVRPLLSYTLGFWKDVGRVNTSKLTQNSAFWISQIPQVADFVIDTH